MVWGSTFMKMNSDLGRETCKKQEHLWLARFHVEEVGLNLAFYYPKTDTFYGIHTEVIPVKVKILPRHQEWSDFVGWQCESDTHDEGEEIAVFNSASEIWDNLRIDGKPFEEVLRESYITALN